MAAGPRTTALPRSLQPLPEESLAGFLLRLSHRVNLPIAVAAVAAGLSDYRRQLPLTWMVGIDAERAARFAATSKLTTAEVSALTLAPMAANFPPLDASTMLRSDPLRWIVTAEPWVFGAATRFCPDCLTGDGSEIQNEHGGGWDKRWRLAPVFACTRHRRLLHHTCPACDAPAHLANRRGGRGALLIPASETVIHPLQCRTAAPGTEACAGRFEQSPDRPRIADHSLNYLLTLQDKLFALLSTTEAAPAWSLGRPVSAATYFADLHFTTALVRVAWDRVQPDTAHRHLVDDLVEYQSPHSDRRLRDLPVERYRNRSDGGLHLAPLDAAAAASLIGLADEILSADDGTETLRKLGLAAFAMRVPRLFRRARLHRRHSPVIEALSSALAFQSGPLYDDWVREGDAVLLEPAGANR
jgi:hypothetical protein